MRALTQYERALANQLYALPKQEAGKTKFSFWKKAPDTQINPALFKQFQSPSAIATLAPFIFHPDTDTATAAIDKITSMLEAMGGVNLHWLDETIRSAYHLCRGRAWAIDWLNADENTVSSLSLRGGKPLITMLTLLACHNNGFVRSKALQLLEIQDPESAFKMAFLRANDWVTQVSEIAFDMIHRGLYRLQDDEIIKNLCLIDQLNQKERRDLSSISSLIKHRLKTKSGCAALSETIAGSDYKTARIALCLLVELSNDVEAVLQLTVKIKDVVIRSKSFLLIEKLPNRESKATFLALLTADAYAPICKKSLYLMAECFPVESEIYLYKSLLHLNPGVREVCRFYLKRTFDYDFVKIYTEKINSCDPHIQVAAITGLSEVGEVKDWKHIDQLSNIKTPKISSAIVGAAGKLACKPMHWYEDKIVHGNPSESRVASDVLSLVEGYSAIETLKLINGIQDSTRFRHILKIARRKDKWDYLLVLLTVLIERPKEGFLEAELKNWLKRYELRYWFVKPEQIYLENLIELLDKSMDVKPLNVICLIRRFITAVIDSNV